jgi:hypothetical protein
VHQGFGGCKQEDFGRFHGGLVFTYGVQDFLDGCEDPPMIRAMAELVGWLKSAIEPSEIFGESYRNLEGN